MKRMAFLLAISIGLPASLSAHADTLLIQRVQGEQGSAMPARGSSMASVEARFGAPRQKVAPVAGPGSRHRNPPITRWLYPGFTVYFENSHVVDAVQTRAGPHEIGPAPVQN